MKTFIRVSKTVRMMGLHGQTKPYYRFLFNIYIYSLIDAK